jgi:thiamine-phosphate pyrophosphorylase
VFRVYLVSDGLGGGSGHLCAAASAALSALPPGAAAVQLREPSLGGAALLELARALVPLCRARSAKLLINDRADVALAAGADGVHLPAAGLPAEEARRLLGPGALIGASCHSLAEVRRAREGAADFAVFGPVWRTPGKGEPLGLAALAAAAREGSLPLFALGGVGADNAAAALGAGARGVACIRAVLGAADPRAAAAALWAALEAA